MQKAIPAAILFGLALPALAQNDFRAPFPPHRVMDNLYFVGTEGLGSFLVATPEGHILINTDFEDTVPELKKNVEALGFRFEDIEIILGSHAHGDHMEGDALAKQMTGASVMAMEADVPALRAMRPGGKEHPIDRVLHDGDEVSLGGTTLTANLTPGHTKGCTTWSLDVRENGKTYKAVIVCSYGVNDNYILVDNASYPRIAEDYVATFAKARTLRTEVFLGSHGFWYNVGEKYERSLSRRPGDPNPFVDAEGYLAHVDAQESRYRAMLAEQQRAAH